MKEYEYPEPKRNNPQGWRKNVSKAKHNAGEAHVSMRKVQKQARSMKNGCSVKCKKKCHFNVTEEQRKTIFEKFWGLADYTYQWCFIGNSVTEENVNRRVKIQIDGEDPSRKSAYRYHFTLEKSNDLEVCKQMFLNTLGIGNKWVRTASLKKKAHSGAIPVDSRGRLKKLNEASSLRRKDVINHIKSFPTVESHYCRKDCKAMFLPENLNRQKM